MFVSYLLFLLNISTQVKILLNWRPRYLVIYIIIYNSWHNIIYIRYVNSFDLYLWDNRLLIVPDPGLDMSPLINTPYIVKTLIWVIRNMKRNRPAGIWWIWVKIPIYWWPDDKDNGQNIKSDGYKYIKT